ncbi:MAG: hypothetical protein ACC682_05265 [Gemmatimonadota bacterium]
MTLAVVSLGSPLGALAQASPANERRVVDRAERLRQSGRTEEARTELIDLLTRAPASADALALLYELSAAANGLDVFLRFAEAADIAARPRGGRIRELWIRGLLAAEMADSARSVAERWVDEAPGEETPILTLASTLVEAGNLSRALDVLRNATDAGAGTRSIQLERADLLVAVERLPEAVDVWVDLLSGDDPAIDETAEDLAQAPDPRVALGMLVDALDTSGPGARSGALLAVRLGDAAAGRRLAARVGERERAQFLQAYVREADLTDQNEEAAWAASELIILSPRPADKLRWRDMVAQRSLAAGDTATARDAFAAIARETEPGAGPHGAATRRLFGLLAADPARIDAAVELLDRYAREYPDSIRPRASMYGMLAEGRARAGDLAGAEETLIRGRDALGGETEVFGGLGPIDAAGGRLAFWAGSRDSAIARMGRSLAEPGLPASERTKRIQLLTMLQSADSAEVALTGAAGVGLHGDPGGFDLSPTIRALAGAPASAGRAAALTYLAGLAAAANRQEVAAGLWRRVADGFPGTPEAPAAMLALARASGRDDAVRWLERLIVGYPESALAPIARRLLAELNDGGIGG